MNFVAYQILWTLTMVLFLIICYHVITCFTRIRFARPLCEVLLCLIILVYMLAFRVNF